MGRRNGAYPRPHRRTAGTHGRSHVCRTVRPRTVTVAGTKGTRGCGTVDRFRMIRPMVVTRAKVVVAGVLRTITVVVVAGAEIVIVAGTIRTVIVSVVVTWAEIVVVAGVIRTVVVTVVVTQTEIVVVAGVIRTVVVTVVVTRTEAIVGPRGALLIVIVTEPVTAPRAYVGVVVPSAPRSYCGMIPCLI